MSERVKEDDRRDAWIDRRNASGYHWPTMLKAMAAIRVTEAKATGLVLNASEIAAPGYPHTYWVTPTQDGRWFHAGSGETGSLFDHMTAIALVHTELNVAATGALATDSAVPNPEDGNG